MSAAATLDFAAARLSRLPLNELDVWEVAHLRWPKWIEDGRRPAYRPRVAIAISRDLGLLGLSELVPPDDLPRARPLDAMVRLADTADPGYRPGRVLVRDPALAFELAPKLASMGIDLAVEDSLPAIDGLERHLLADRSGVRPRPGPLLHGGVTVERWRAFADAAKCLYERAPWYLLGDEEPLRVESPDGGPGFAVASVLGASGVPRGIAFFDSIADLAAAPGPGTAARPATHAVRSRWVMTYLMLQELPFEDADVWEDRDLPLANLAAYPMFLWRGASEPARRPNASQLAWAEGLLRALAASGEDDFDAGRWSRRVATADGEREYVLTLPDVLIPREIAPGAHDSRAYGLVLTRVACAIEREGLKTEHDVARWLRAGNRRPPEPSASTPRERAMERLTAAFAAQGRLRLKRAREAIALWPDCAQGWILRAEAMTHPERAEDLWREAASAADRAMSELRPNDARGRLLAFQDASWWLNAKLGYGHQLWENEKDEAALDCWREMLTRDAEDHARARVFMVPALLESWQDDEASQWLERFAQDRSAVLEYARALVWFRREGASGRANAALRRAVHACAAAVGPLIRGREPGAEGGGRKDDRVDWDARIVVRRLGAAFEDTRGARAWLRRVPRPAGNARQKTPQARP